MQMQLTRQSGPSNGRRGIRALRLATLTFVLSFCFSTPMLGVYYTSGGGGGGDSAGLVTGLPEETVISDTLKTDADKELNATLAISGTPTITLADNTANFADITPSVVQAISENDLPLVVTNTGVALEFPADALLVPSVVEAIGQPKVTVNISARVISTSEAKEIRENALLGSSAGIYSIGSKMVSLDASLSNSKGTYKISQFNGLVAVTIDLSDKTLTPEDIAQLTAVRVIANSDGTYAGKPLGGTYDAVNKTFTFYTDQFSVYSVVKKPTLVNINMTIDNQNVNVNGAAAALDVPPMILSSRTMIPLRFVGEKMGMTVDWDAATRTITMSQNGKTITLVVDKPEPNMDVPATIINSRTMVPIRYVSENFGATVNWIASTRTVQVFK